MTEAAARISAFVEPGAVEFGAGELGAVESGAGELGAVESGTTAWVACAKVGVADRAARIVGQTRLMNDLRRIVCSRSFVDSTAENAVRIPSSVDITIRGAGITACRGIFSKIASYRVEGCEKWRPLVEAAHEWN